MVNALFTELVLSRSLELAVRAGVAGSGYFSDLILLLQFDRSPRCFLELVTRIPKFASQDSDESEEFSPHSLNDLFGI